MHAAIVTTGASRGLQPQPPGRTVAAAASSCARSLAGRCGEPPSARAQATVSRSSSAESSVAASRRPRSTEKAECVGAPAYGAPPRARWATTAAVQRGSESHAVTTATRPTPHALCSDVWCAWPVVSPGPRRGDAASTRAHAAASARSEAVRELVAPAPLHATENADSRLSSSAVTTACVHRALASSAATTSDRPALDAHNSAVPPRSPRSSGCTCGDAAMARAAPAAALRSTGDGRTGS